MNVPSSIRGIALLLIATLLGHQCAFAGKPVDAAEIKSRIEARGVGQGVRVVMADNTEKKGLIVSIGTDSFSMKPKGAVDPVNIAYAQVTSVHRDKLSTGQKVGIGVAIGAAAVAIVATVIAISFRHSFSKI